LLSIKRTFYHKSSDGMFLALPGQIWIPFVNTATS
jgi:hypothetical protein